jgi:phosphoribosyl-AMP cyclohydrolase/phosphoribosyl-ATP pyrophosphohydrolase/phosphoribosyl-AMP cyclohydrolase
MNQNLFWIEQLKFNDKGLIPAIAQDYQDSTILMMAWMNQESILRTLETREAHYWSPSRNELWHKGLKEWTYPEG